MQSSTIIVQSTFEMKTASYFVITLLSYVNLMMDKTKRQYKKTGGIQDEQQQNKLNLLCEVNLQRQII